MNEETDTPTQKISPSAATDGSGLAPHSPAPWEVGKVQGRGQLAVGTLVVGSRKHRQEGFSGGVICAIAPPGQITDEDESNARVIAAAPEMMTALQTASDALDAYDMECMRVFGGCVKHNGRAGKELMAVIAAIESSRTALAKALGQNGGPAEPPAPAERGGTQ